MRINLDNPWHFTSFIVALFVGALAVGCGWWVLNSYFEAETYSRLTGVSVTTWDAMWVELRVIEPGEMK